MEELTDEYEWADAWQIALKADPGIPHDRHAMLAWFKAAIEAGRRAGLREGERP